MRCCKAGVCPAVCQIAIACLATSCLGQPRALADGVMIERIPLGRAAQMVASPRQEALLVREGDKVQVTLRTSFRAGPQELAWVVPVPHEPESVQQADDAVFTKLEALTTPRFERRSVSRHHVFGCSAGDRTSRESIIGRVAVAETGQAGMYDYTVLTATGTSVLGQWLTDHGYDVPAGSEPIFKRYVDQGWCWLAIRLDAQRAIGEVLAPPPIQYTYRDTRCVFPLVISQLSADENNEVLLYVLGESYHQCENWTTMEIYTDMLTPQEGTSSGTNYESSFQTLTEQNGGHMFVCEFARVLNRPEDSVLLGELTGKDRGKGPSDKVGATYLTRLRAVIPRRAMDRDVMLVRQERYQPIEPLHELTSISRSVSRPDAAMVIGLLALALMRITSRRRSLLQSTSD
jgi:hypothetical protein